MSIRFPDDQRELHDRIRAQAFMDRRSINSEVLHLLEIGIAVEEERNFPNVDGSSSNPRRKNPDSVSPYRARRHNSDNA